MEDVELGLVRFQRRLAFHAQEEVPREERVPRAFGHEADRKLLARVGPAAEVLDPELAGGEMRADAVEQGVETCRIERLVDLAPGDAPLGGRVLDDELVLGGAAGIRRGVDDQRTAGTDPSGPAPDRLLVERGCETVPMDRGSLVEAEGLEGVGGGGRARHVLPFGSGGKKLAQDSAPFGRMSTLTCLRTCA